MMSTFLWIENGLYKETLACHQQQEKYFSQIIWSSTDVLKKTIVRAA